MLCPKCGSANTDGSTFCIGCGTDLGVTAMPAPGEPASTTATDVTDQPGSPPPGSPPPGQQSPWPEQPQGWNPPPPGYGAPPRYGQPPGYGQPPPPGYGGTGYGQYGPQGYPGGPQQGYAPYYGPQVNNNMAMAVIALVLGVFGCLLPAIPGLVAVIFSSQVNPKLAMGDIAGAERSARNAKGWAIVGYVVFGLAFLAFAILIIVAAANSSTDSGSF